MYKIAFKSEVKTLYSGSCNFNYTKDAVTISSNLSLSLDIHQIYVVYVSQIRHTYQIYTSNIHNVYNLYMLYTA